MADPDQNPSSQSSQPHPSGSSPANRAADSNADKRTMILGGDTQPNGEGPAPQNPQDWVGRTLGKYQIRSVLGVGGMGVVLRAIDPMLERQVAIKVLPPEFSEDENAMRRFLAEAKSAGQLNSPHAVTVYEVGQAGPVWYLVMELVMGGSLEDRIQREGPIPVAEATRMMIEACKGLSAAHHAGLIHRDIKPANLLLNDDGDVKVSDFGLAKRARTQTYQATQAGQIVGTPYYMSPEQCESRTVDARSDIYSLAATYYSLLTGQSPYEDRDSVMQVMFAHCNAAPPDPREIRAQTPEACSLIIERGMSKNPDERYQSMEELRSDLEAVLAALSGAGIRLPSRSGTYSRVTPAASSSPSVAAASHPDLHQSSSVMASPSRKSPLPILLGSVAILAVLAGIATLVQMNRGGSTGGEGGGIPLAVVDGSGSEPESTPPVVPVPPSGEPIRIGIVHSLTGTMEHSEAPVVDAILLAIDEINQSGGVMGRPVEPVVADGRSNPEVFAREVRRLIDEENVCTVFGCWTSASRKSVVPIVEERNHLLVYPVQYEGIEESPNVIYTGAAPNQQIVPAVKWAFAFENKRKFFLVGSDYVFPRVAHEIIKDELKVLGGELVGEAFLPLGSQDMSSVIEQIQEAKPDVILNTINGDSNHAFFAALRNAGITPEEIPTISFSIGEQEIQHLDPALLAGDYAAWNYFQTINSEANREFVKDFRGKYGPQRVVSDPMEAAYFGVKMWAQAVNEVQDLSPALIRRGMLNQRFRAPSDEVRIDPATQHTFKTPRIGRIQSDGSFQIVWTAANPEAPRPYPASRTTADWRALLHDLYTSWNNSWSAPAAK